jgi:hypothetical protein
MENSFGFSTLILDFVCITAFDRRHSALEVSRRQFGRETFTFIGLLAVFRHTVCPTA